MSDKLQQYRVGQEKIFAHNDKLKEGAKLFLKKLYKNKDVKSITLTNGSYIEYSPLFFNFLKSQNDKVILNVTSLKDYLGANFTQWCRILAETSDFKFASQDKSREDFFQQLCFQLPNINWLEFKNEINRERNLDITIFKDAYKAAEYLLNNNETILLADLGAKLFKNSKRLKDSQVIKWLCRMLLQKSDFTHDDYTYKELLENFNLLNNLTNSSVLIYGPFTYKLNSKSVDFVNFLYEQNESIILSLDNLLNMSELKVDMPVLTIENETIFNRIKQYECNFALVYTGGFPNRAVRKFISLLAKDTVLYHWGDSDPEGYEIASILHEIHPLKLYNCTIKDLANNLANSLPLSIAKERRIKRLLLNSDFPFKAELEWTLANNCFLEQESFIPYN